jgi:flagellar motor protein MotB
MRPVAANPGSGFCCAWAAGLIALVFATGCQQPMGSAGQSSLSGSLGTGPWQANSRGGLFAGAGQVSPGQVAQADQAQYSQLAQQIESLNQRLGQFNSDNDNLHTQVAALQQRLQNANSYNEQLRQQLADTATRLQQAQYQSQQFAATAQQQTAAAQSGATGNSPGGGPWQNTSGGEVPAQFAGATIRANNSLMQGLASVQLPGFRAWMDGDVIRIEGPTDRLFVSGTWQINPNDAMTIASLAGAIRQNYPQQVIGVEAHWDGSPIQPATTSHHQLTANHALAVFELLVKSGLPNEQVFTMAMGSNRPRYGADAAASGISPNRRIEIVIYPETWR